MLPLRGMMQFYMTALHTWGLVMETKENGGFRGTVGLMAWTDSKRKKRTLRR